MKFGLVDPKTLRREIVEVEGSANALAMIGLHPGAVDHGTVFKDPVTGGGVARVCYEYALFVPVEQQRYFSIGNVFCAGPHMFYQFDAEGETVDLFEIPAVVFYRDAGQIEGAIRQGLVERPIMAVNGQIIWSWPNPASAGLVRTEGDHGQGGQGAQAAPSTFGEY